MRPRCKTQPAAMNEAAPTHPTTIPPCRPPPRDRRSHRTCCLLLLLPPSACLLLPHNLRSARAAWGHPAEPGACPCC